MDKVDFKRSLPSFRATQGRFDLIEVPDSQYLMINGHGDPNTSPDFASALTSLYRSPMVEFFSKLGTRSRLCGAAAQAVVGR